MCRKPRRKPRRQEAEEAVDEGAHPSEALKSRRGRKEENESAVELLAAEALLRTLDSNLKSWSTEDQLLQTERRLSTKLVSALVKKREYRGSSTQLELSTLYRPDSFPHAEFDVNRWLWHEGQSYVFLAPEKEDVQELKALILSLTWRLQFPKFVFCRALRLVDSPVVLALAMKGRSSSCILNGLLRRYGALQLAGRIYPVLGWVKSDQNPAKTAASRRTP